MREIELNGSNYYLCESDKDLKAGRFGEFQRLLILKELGISPIDFVNSTQKVIEALKNNDLYAASVAYNSQITGVDILMKQKSAIEYLFALIVTDQKEDLTDFIKEEVDRKLDKMYKDGLTYGEIEDVVENFLQGCQTHWWKNFRQSLDSLQIA